MTQKTMKKDVFFVKLPTHLMMLQPLDVVCLRPLNRRCGNALNFMTDECGAKETIKPTFVKKLCEYW